MNTKELQELSTDLSKTLGELAAEGTQGVLVALLLIGCAVVLFTIGFVGIIAVVTGIQLAGAWLVALPVNWLIAVAYPNTVTFNQVWLGLFGITYLTAVLKGIGGAFAPKQITESKGD